MEYGKLFKTIGYTFANEAYLTEALTHRSYLNEHPEVKHAHNERLEFLGDAVLELAVTEYLYKQYPNPEGELTNWRAALVNAVSCADVAEHIGLEEFILLSRGEAKEKKTKARMFILANALEALIGALYLDGGFEAARGFVERFVLVKLPFILQHKLYMDPKSRFQESAQEKMGVTPHYKVLSESGPDHNKQFVVGIFLASDLIAQGTGSSKQEGEMQAAEKALEAKGW